MSNDHQSHHSPTSSIVDKNAWRRFAAVTALLVGQGLGLSSTLAAESCGAETPTSARQTSVQVQSQILLRTAQEPLHLGFNLEWVQFQRDFWDAEASTLEPALVRLMAAFSDAVYRYPGGTVSNYLDLAASLGPVERRPPQQPVSWTGPEPMRFGLSEYYDFIAAVQGRPWLVLNVYGRRGVQMPVSALMPTWKRVAEFVKTKQAPLRFELGNELYLPMYKLDAQAYAERALEAAKAMRRAMPDVPSVAVLADFDPPGHRKRDFNRPVARTSPEFIAEFAQHSYYDGPPGGPPVPNRLREICRTVGDLHDAGFASPTIWVTEHARWPGGRTSDPDWKERWPKTHDLGAALGVADYVIGLSQMRAVRGAFLHSLSGTQGPWALVIRGPSGDLIPSAVYRSLEVLAPMFRALDVHGVRTRSTDSAGYAGDYDLRATVSRDPVSGTWHLFAVQRSDQPLRVQLTLPSLADRSVAIEHRYITGAAVTDNNEADSPRRIDVRTEQHRLRFDDAGIVSITLPPLSVNHLTIADSAAGTNKP